MSLDAVHRALRRPAPNDQYKLAQILVPIDDENCMFNWIAWYETKNISPNAWRKFCGAEVGIDLDHDYRKLRNADNNYMQDRAAMKAGNFTGITGIPTQDMAVWKSMGPIANRAQDKRGSSDLAIVRFRRQMLAAAKKVVERGHAIGTTEPLTPHVTVGSFEGGCRKGGGLADPRRRSSAGLTAPPPRYD